MKCPSLALALLLLSGGAQCAPAPAADEAGFRFTATARDFGHYFPSYLANGYFSTMTSVRGTGPERAYMVALMDQAKDDIARPAAIPGWAGIDYNPGTGWLDGVPLNRHIFQDYTQTLDMHAATLTTGYRFVYAGKATDVKVVTFVSQADRHLAATRITLTPSFSGVVQLRFPLRLWSEYAPRFPIARLSWPKLQDAVIASGQNLHDKPMPIADRAPIWYPGYTRVLSDGGDTHDLTVWLHGRARNSLGMAEAAAIGVPAGLHVQHAALTRTATLLSLDLKVDVQKGHTYAFTKYIAASRHGWGGRASADRTLAKAARRRGFDTLLARHRAAWHRLWGSDIVVDGAPAVQKALHSDLYYLLSNSTAGTAWPMAACALTPNYAGHAFWDNDSWDFPALLLLHPARARSLIMFRHRTMAAARANAAAHHVKGLKYPWEADPQDGSVQTPHFAQAMYREVHLNADVAIAQWQYYLASGDSAWLKRYGWPVIRGVARYWTSRVTWDKARDRYEILHVTSPDEDYDDVPNDTFTNAAARKALRIADKAARAIGAQPDPRWADIAAKMYIPFDAAAQRHRNFGASAKHDRVTWMGSTLIWLMYPNLDLKMSSAVRRHDFDYQLEQVHASAAAPNEMMMTMLTVGAAELGQANTAGKWLERNLRGFLKPPFNVRSETPSNNAGYILATSAGFVQSVMYGLTGLRIEHGGVVQAYPPVLPPGWHKLTLKNVSIRGRRYDIVVDRDAAGRARLRRTALPSATRSIRQ